MRVVERSFSDLRRHPNDVAADLDVGDVLLRRRDEPDLRLTLADRDAERSDVFRVLALAFRNLAVHSPGVLEGAVLDSFAWSEFLPMKDRRLFLDEFSRTLIASAEIDTYELLLSWCVSGGQPLRCTRSLVWRSVFDGRSKSSMGSALVLHRRRSPNHLVDGCDGRPPKADRVAPREAHIICTRMRIQLKTSAPIFWVSRGRNGYQRYIRSNR
jgi:hypothetical protein